MTGVQTCALPILLEIMIEDVDINSKLEDMVQEINEALEDA